MTEQGSVERSRTAARVQFFANVAVILASIAALWAVVPRLQREAGGEPPVYAIGERIGAVEGIDFSRSRRTLVMALREDCRFCRDSVPFYQNLIAKLSTVSEGNLRMVVVSTDEPARLSDYLLANHIRVGQVARYKVGSLKIPGTPFLVLVDSVGQVKRLWRGRLDAQGEQDVLAQLTLTFE